MLRLRDLMTTDVVTLSPDTTLRDATALLATRHVSGAPVVAGGRVVGVVSVTDLLDFVATAPATGRGRDAAPDAWDALDEVPPWNGDEDPPSAFFVDLWESGSGEDDVGMVDGTLVPGGPADPLAEHTVAEVMTRRLRALAPSVDVAAAADYMRTVGIHRVLVMERGRLVGIVTTSDIVRAVADRRIVARTFVFGPPAHA